ncbi:MAG: hypothetical protein HY812_17240 [Planctomycetes bacterium]|nr:hypothetical protein [Planctomycetota bacterium]
MSWKRVSRPGRTTRDPSRVFSYVVVQDGGFAPNPFHGWCTLACCKPRIRGAAAPGDVIIGLSRRCERIVYVMRVDERLSFEQYWADPRFRAKRPEWESPLARRRRGDNIYRPDGAGGFVQLRSAHWDHKRDQESQSARRRDTGANAVLVSRDFVYFGGQGPVLPRRLQFLRTGRGHRCRFSPEQIAAVHDFFARKERGVLGPPAGWSAEDDSWRPSCA